MTPALQNRCAIVTGASQGLGFEIARKYLAAGASLIICARDRELLDRSARQLEPLAASGQSIIALAADISSSHDVDALMARALREFGRLDILVNNAGVLGPAGAAESVPWEAWLRTIEINLLGAVLLSRAVVPHFKQAGHGKFIQLSGGGATNPLPNLSAYAASKAAVIRFMETLAEETRAHHIDVNAIAPGQLDTRLLDEIIASGPEGVGTEHYERALLHKRNGGVPLAKAADLAVFLGSSLSDGITGKLISAVWDDWAGLPDRVRELRDTDIYTLRRILPEDRAMNWRRN
jgi:NAD(P)-dependent dehydrogenase (short-subunit alcohol dehydrogenase family)